MAAIAITVCKVDPNDPSHLAAAAAAAAATDHPPASPGEDALPPLPGPPPAVEELLGAPPPVTAGRPAGGGGYDCPVYRTQLRRGAVTTLRLPSRVCPDNWTLSAVSLLLDPYRP